VVVAVEGDDEGGGTGTIAMMDEEAVVVVVVGLEEVVVEEEVGLGLGEPEAVTVGVMTTVDVELIAPEATFKPSQLFPPCLLCPLLKVEPDSQPISTHEYPGIQHPPPGLFGQLV